MFASSPHAKITAEVEDAVAADFRHPIHYLFRGRIVRQRNAVKPSLGDFPPPTIVQVASMNDAEIPALAIRQGMRFVGCFHQECRVDASGFATSAGASRTWVDS